MNVNATKLAELQLPSHLVSRQFSEAPEEATIRSWKRSAATHHLQPELGGERIRLSQQSLSDHVLAIEDVLWTASAGVAQLHSQLLGAGYVTLLTDAQGVTVDYRKNPSFDSEIAAARIGIGSKFSEADEGTCGVGLCLLEKTAVTVHKSEHYLDRNVGLSCTSAPIFLPSRELVSVLSVASVSAPDEKRSQHMVMQMVKSTATLIENAIFFAQFNKCWIINVGLHHQLLRAQTGGLLAVNEQGMIVGANAQMVQIASSAGLMRLNGMNIQDVIPDFFGFSKLGSIASFGKAKDSSWLGREFQLGAAGSSIRVFAFITAPNQPSARASAQPGTLKPVSGAAHSRLDALCLGDEVMGRNISIAKKIIDQNISIMLSGETGTGKELFAKAIHESSARRAAPFVALNCSALPASLIESELFGYRAGAFTGANPKGYRGKIVESSQGTLFLDEIGDMPVELQARLLRVLAEGEVTPLGGEGIVHTNLRVICASHRDLKTLVASGSFRSDLYYRLNGAHLHLPALRDRSDLSALIDAIFAQEYSNQAQTGAHSPLVISTSCFNFLLAHEWPGNLRQLRNVIRYAIGVHEGEQIEITDLPADITGVDRLVVANKSDHRTAVLASLKSNRWCVASSARALGISRATLYRWIERYTIISPKDQ